MADKKLSEAYKTILEDRFPPRMSISFFDDEGRRSELVYEKARWSVGGEIRGLRYGDNPDQSAALYRPLFDPAGGNLALADARLFEPGEGLVSAAKLLQFGKHPGKTNFCDVDAALNILRYLSDRPTCAVIKHNNPSGVAQADTIRDAYGKAYFADRVAAFGGAVVVNRSLDLDTARAISESYCEVVAAPDFEAGAVEILMARKNLRIMSIAAIERLELWASRSVLDIKAMLDGSLVVQDSFVSRIRSRRDFLPARCVKDGVAHEVCRDPSDAEWDDMVFGWLVECGLISNSVIYVKDRVTLGIGSGEQDRVGVAILARDKAYRKLEDRLFWERRGRGWNEATGADDEAVRKEIAAEVRACHGGLRGSVMVSDAFFPFRDGIEVGLREGVAAVVQPGGSLRDHEVIDACNEYGAAMKFTGQRCFRH